MKGERRQPDRCIIVQMNQIDRAVESKGQIESLLSGVMNAPSRPGYRGWSMAAPDAMSWQEVFVASRRQPGGLPAGRVSHV